MKKFLSLLCLSLISSVGCGQHDTSSAPSADTQAGAQTNVEAPAQVTAAEKPAAGQTAAAVNADDPLTAGEAVEPEEETAAPSASEQANIRLAASVAPTKTAASRWQAGKHYRAVVPAQPTDAPPEKVEVLELFWFGCMHCYGLEPYIDSWLQKKKPAYVEFKKVPVVWGPVHRMHAQLFYALEALKREDLFTAVFREIQVAHNPLSSQDPAEAEKMQIQFVKRHGIDEQTFRKAYNSFDVQTKLQRAEQLGRRYQADTVPLIVVNGKYVTDIESAGGHSRLIEVMNDLATQEQKKD